MDRVDVVYALIKKKNEERVLIVKMPVAPGPFKEVQLKQVKPKVRL